MSGLPKPFVCRLKAFLTELDKDLRLISWDDYDRPRTRRRWWHIP
jgi:hypothetical protein